MKTITRKSNNVSLYYISDDTNVDIQCEMIKYAVKNYDEYLESIKDNSEILKEQQGPKAVQRMLDIITEA